MNKKIFVFIILVIVIIAAVFFSQRKTQEITNQEKINPKKKIVYNNLSQKLIQTDKQTGYYFCFNTNEYIHETKLSDIEKYILENFSYNISVSGPDVTFNHNKTKSNQYVCYNSIGQNQSISCWNNILNPLIKNPDCISLI